MSHTSSNHDSAVTRNAGTSSGGVSGGTHPSASTSHSGIPSRPGSAPPTMSATHQPQTNFYPVHTSAPQTFNSHTGQTPYQHAYQPQQPYARYNPAAMQQRGYAPQQAYPGYQQNMYQRSVPMPAQPAQAPTRPAYNARPTRKKKILAITTPDGKPVDLKHTKAEAAATGATGSSVSGSNNKSAAKELAALVQSKAGKESKTEADEGAAVKPSAKKTTSEKPPTPPASAEEASSDAKIASFLDEVAVPVSKKSLSVKTKAAPTAAPVQPPTPDTVRAEDDWDTQDPAAMKIAKTPTNTAPSKPAMPSFRPGGSFGGMGAMEARPTSSGIKSSNKHVYTRTELMEHRKRPELQARPEKLLPYTISSDPQWVAAGGGASAQSSFGRANSGSVRSTGAVSYPPRQTQSYSRGGDQRGGGGGYNRPSSQRPAPSNRGGGGGGGGNMWSRGHKQPEQQRQQQQGGGGRKGGRGKGGRGANYVSPPVGDYQPLKSGNAWTRDKNKTDDENVATMRAFQTQLNKVTPDKFERITKNILAIEVKNRAVFKQIIVAICNVALTQPIFAGLYAELCAKISKKSEQFLEQMVHVMQKEDGAWYYNVGDDSCVSKAYRSQAEAQAAGEKICTFKRILLSKCQEEFEKTIDWNAFEKEVDWASLDENETKRTKAEVNYNVTQAKKRMLGNIKFIGELFMKHMLKAKIMHHCITKLLVNVENPEIEHIESVCKLLTTIGKELDSNKYRSYVDAYFSRLTHMKNLKTLATRIKFMLADVIELRKRKWKPRRDQKGPATIAQVRQQAAQEELKKSQQSSRGGRGSDRRDDRRNSQPSRNDRGGRGGHNNKSQQGGGFMPKVYTKKKSTQDARSSSSSVSGSSSSSKPSYSISLKPGGSTTSFRPGGSSSGLKLGPGGNSARGNSSRGGSRNSGRRSRSPAGRKPVPRRVPEPKKAPQWPLEKFEKKCTSTIKEFMGILDEKEVAECLKEYAQADNAPFVHMTMRTVVNSRHSDAKARNAVPKLFTSLCGPLSVLTSEDIIKGLKKFAEDFDDLCIDLPRAPQYVADLYAGLVADDVCTLGALMKTFDKTCISGGRPEKVLSKLLQALKKAKGADVARKILGSNAASCKQVLRRDTLDKFLADSYDGIKDLASAQTA